MSVGELVLLAVIAVLAIGARNLPEAGRMVGKGLRNFHRGMREARDALDGDSPPASRPPPPGSRLID